MQRFDRIVFCVSFAFFCVVIAYQVYLFGLSCGLFCPALMCDNSEQELGTVQGDARIVLQFSLENNGWRSLAIESAQPACGSGNDLEIQEFSPMTLRPGGKQTLAVLFRPRLLKGDVVKKVVVVSNDYRHPRKVLSVRATVVPVPPSEEVAPILAPPPPP